MKTIKLYKHNIFWGNSTFIKPDLESFNKLVNEGFETIEANIIWTTYNRGHIQLKVENGLYTYAQIDGNFYFLFANQTLSKSKKVVVFEIVPDVWVNKILNKAFDGVLITTSNENEILDNDNLVKPINSYWKPLESVNNKLLNLHNSFNFGFIYELKTEWISYYEEFPFGGSKLSAKTGWIDLNTINPKLLNKFKNLPSYAYKMNRWIDGSPLPSQFKDFYVIGKKVNGVSENVPKRIENTSNLGYFNFQKFGVNKTAKYNVLPILRDGLNYGFGNIDNYRKYSDLTLLQKESGNKVEIIPIPQNSQNELNYLIFNEEKQLINKTTLIRDTIGIGTHTYITETKEFNSFLVDKPIQTDFTYNQTIRKDTGNWQINLHPFFSELKDDEYLLDITNKVIITKNNVYLHKSLLVFESEEKKETILKFENTNEVKYTLLFRDGESVELPYGESIIKYNNKHYENGTVLTLTIENERLKKKWIKTYKETNNFLDNNLKYLQLQQLNRNQSLNVFKNEIENKKSKWNLVSNIIGSTFGILGGGAAFNNALGQNNYSGITSSIGSTVNSITNISNSIINYKYDNEIRKREFENSLFDYNISKQTLERQLLKLDTTINFISEWNELLNEEKLGDDGFVIIEQKPSQHTKKLYNLYLNNIGYSTNTYILKKHKLTNPGIYQFAFFIEKDIEDREDVRSILTNPIKIISIERKQ